MKDFPFACRVFRDHAALEGGLRPMLFFGPTVLFLEHMWETLNIGGHLSPLCQRDIAMSCSGVMPYLPTTVSSHRMLLTSPVELIHMPATTGD